MSILTCASNLAGYVLHYQRYKREQKKAARPTFDLTASLAKGKKATAAAKAKAMVGVRVPLKSANQMSASKRQKGRVGNYLERQKAAERKRIQQMAAAREKRAMEL